MGAKLTRPRKANNVGPAVGAPSPARAAGVPPGGLPRATLADAIVTRTEAYALTDPGFGAVDEENQDMALTVTPLPGGSSRVVAGIFDGHGPEGRAVAVRIKERLVSTLVDNARREGDRVEPGPALAPAVAEAPAAKDAANIKRSFADLESACTPIHQDSGACATVVVFDENERRLMIANVGDSKAVLGRGTGQPEMLQLTEDHYPSVSTEKERIEAAGGRVAACVDVQLGELGPMRVWKGNSDRPGLPLSRTIGDALAKEVGVTAEPHVIDTYLTPEDRFLIVGSSGMWKVLTPQETVDLVSKQVDVKSAAKKLVDEAKRRYEVLWQGENTSALVIVFPGPAP